MELPRARGVNAVPFSSLIEARRPNLLGAGRDTAMPG